jgi:hypothetical protein
LVVENALCFWRRGEHRGRQPPRKAGRVLLIALRALDLEMQHIALTEQQIGAAWPEKTNLHTGYLCVEASEAAARWRIAIANVNDDKRCNDDRKYSNLRRRLPVPSRWGETHSRIDLLDLHRGFSQQSSPSGLSLRYLT